VKHVVYVYSYCLTLEIKFILSITIKPFQILKNSKLLDSSDPLNLLLKLALELKVVGLFESIHLFVYKLMLKNAISGVKRRARLCLEQNGQHFQHLL
jgi:hypothetical protein